MGKIELNGRSLRLNNIGLGKHSYPKMEWKKCLTLIGHGSDYGSWHEWEKERETIWDYIFGDR